jgi:uncharacterized C2H2 Zn-finger protein
VADTNKQLTCPKCSNVFNEPLIRFLPFNEEQYKRIFQIHGKDFQICPKCKEVFNPNPASGIGGIFKSFLKLFK